MSFDLLGPVCRLLSVDRARTSHASTDDDNVYTSGKGSVAPIVPKTLGSLILKGRREGNMVSSTPASLEAND